MFFFFFLTLFLVSNFLKNKILIKKKSTKNVFYGTIKSTKHFSSSSSSYSKQTSSEILCSFYCANDKQTFIKKNLLKITKNGVNHLFIIILQWNHSGGVGAVVDVGLLLPS